MRNISNFLNSVSKWGLEEENILAIGLVGSYAREAANKDSDIDLMIITKDPEIYISNNNWIEKFGEVKKIKDESWSQLKTKRVFFKIGLEVEFNFDKKSWANSQDSGTQRVIKDGMKVLIDKQNILEDLVSSLS